MIEFRERARRVIPAHYEGWTWAEARDRAEAEIRQAYEDGRSSVSDQSREAVKTEGLDPKDASAVTEGQTPHTSPLNKGAVEKPIAILKMVAANSERDGLPNTAASLRQVIDLLLSLSSNLEETQKENERLKAELFDAAEKVEVLEEERRKQRSWLCEAKRARGYSDKVSFDTVWIETCADADQLSLLQKRLEEVEGALKTTTDVLDTFGNLSDALISPEAWSIHGAEEAIAVALAALHPKGESR